MRLALQLTQGQVAEAVGLDVATVHRVEMGVNRGAESAKKIASLFSPLISEMEILYPKDYPDFVCKPQPKDTVAVYKRLEQRQKVG